MSDQSIRDEFAHFIAQVCSEEPTWSAAVINTFLASPVFRRIQAEAWDEGFDAHDMDWKHHDANNWGDEDCIDATYNPYRDEEPNV